MKTNISILIVILSTLLSCAQQDSTFIETNVLKRGFSVNDFFTNDISLEEYTDSIYNALSVKDRLGQMLTIEGSRLGQPVPKILNYIENQKIGGVIFLKDHKDTILKQTQQFSDTAKAHGVLPLLYSFDAEPSLLNRKLEGVPQVPQTYMLSDYDVSKAVGAQIARILKETNIYLNFAPVCDISVNKAVINKRSYGRNEKMIGDLPEAFILGSQQNGVAATAKHFPGHGNVKNDSHHELVFINGELKELNIFRKAIDAGVLAVMVGHIAIKNNQEFNTNGQPSSLSRKIVSGLLKDSLNFDGLVVTDAMNMGAVKKLPNADVLAAKAGCDMILFPANPKAFVETMLKELKSNPALERQIEHSVKKIIRLKICLGIIKPNHV